MLNIIVLTFEVLYYSLFMAFTRREGKFYKYIILFSLISIVGVVITTNNLLSYFLLILMMTLGLKYIVGTKTSMFDMFLIVLMLFIKFIIEFISYVLFYKIIGFNHFTTTMLFDIIKIGLVLMNRNNLYKVKVKLDELWANNNFYIRYIFSILVYIYVIVVCILKIVKFK